MRIPTCRLACTVAEASFGRIFPVPHRLLDLRDKQIAAVLDTSPDAVNKIHNRALARMNVRGKGSLMHLLSTRSMA